MPQDKQYTVKVKIEVAENWNDKAGVEVTRKAIEAEGVADMIHRLTAEGVEITLDQFNARLAKEALEA